MDAVKVKICGLTRLEDARGAIEAGAAYLGFNFHPPSPRYIEPANAWAIVSALRSADLKFIAVGVFVDRSASEIREVASTVRLDAVQLHGAETPATAAELEGLYRIKALKIRDEASIERMHAFNVEAFLADAPHPELPGGSGMTYDYALVAPAARIHRIFLAGGLTPENVADAIRAVRPACVDVASGVESAAGVKDGARMIAFCRAAQGVRI